MVDLQEVYGNLKRGAVFLLNPHFSHLLVTKRRKGRPDKERDRGPRKRTVRYVEEADGGGTRLRVAQSGRIIAPMQ